MASRSSLRAARSLHLCNSTFTTSRVLTLGPRYSTSAPASIVDAGFWKSLIPKPLRRENRQDKKVGKPVKEWNPATFFIVMFLLVGSMSIQMIALRNSYDRYVRQSSIRIGLLKDVVERILKGEDVDVEKALGTGDPQKEADWEDLLQAIEREEAMKKSTRREKQRQSEAKAAAENEPLPTPQPTISTTSAKEGKSSGFGNFF